MSDKKIEQDNKNKKLINFLEGKTISHVSGFFLNQEIEIFFADNSSVTIEPEINYNQSFLAYTIK